MDTLVDNRGPVSQVEGFDVGIAIAGGDVVLSWSAVGDATDYTVWHSTHAHFEPGEDGSTLLSTVTTTAFADPVAGDGNHGYYRVVAHDSTGDMVSTAVGKYAHVIYPGYNKIAQPLDTGVTDGQAFALNHDPGSTLSSHRFDGPTQSYLSWFPGGGSSFSYGPGEVPIVNVGWSVWGLVHEEVGHVPAEGGLQVPLAAGLNIVTVPLEYGDTMASDWLAAVPGAWRIGRWDAQGQYGQWHDGLSIDFSVEGGRHLYVDTTVPSMWPPTLITEPDPEPEPEPEPPIEYDADTNPLPLMGEALLVASGFDFAEAPLWLADEGALLLSDIEGDSIHRYEPDVGTTMLRGPTGTFSNGRALDPAGLVVECQHGPQHVVRIETDGSETVLASHWQGMPLNSPNDVIVGDDGTVYFVDPTIGSWPQYGGVQHQPLGFSGLYRIDPTGQLHLEDDTLSEPTGIALSPDGSTLYVGDYGTGQLHHYPVEADGSVGTGAMLSTAAQGADGMCLDVMGNIYQSGEFGLRVFRPDGTLWGTYVLPQLPSANCAFGGPDLTTLYVTADSSLFAIDVTIPGAP
ncbi:MAG: SMP-30/gluconolactonase/LRE family protein [Deltaproteobacteria bacterium]|nr:SMP-30/gluconolactonase/LRE family protein [Deltaproteobacteria bacterium]